MAVDVSKKDAYTKAFSMHGIHVGVRGEGRNALWCLMNDAKTWGLTTGFDVDLDRVMAQLDAGRPLTQVDVTFHNAPSVVTSTKTSATMTGGPWCFMCGEPGGLPSPNMKGAAKLLDVRVFWPHDDARMVGALLHPGRCRKRLRQLLDTAKANRTGILATSK